MSDVESVESYIEEQAEILNNLRKQRLLTMIARLQREHYKRTADTEAGAREVVRAVLATPDQIVDQLSESYSAPNSAGSAAVSQPEVRSRGGCCG